MFERDIDNIFASARNMLGDTYLPIIRRLLIEGVDLAGAEELQALDKSTIATLAERELQKLTLEERRKIIRMQKENISSEEILKQVDTRFLSIDLAREQLANAQITNEQNSAIGRTTSIVIGVILLIATGVIVVFSGRLFYILPVIGLGLIIKGLTTQRAAYED
ncbi:MAG: hypothetical protein KDC49_10705 [Saprospiraceae bacterium]|nr:hypothetical protein [Saprospiraceae bacterium]